VKKKLLHIPKLTGCQRLFKGYYVKLHMKRNPAITCTVFRKRDIVCVIEYNKHIVYLLKRTLL